MSSGEAFGRRFAATFIDGLIVGVIMIAPVMFLVFRAVQSNPGNPSPLGLLPYLLQPLMGLTYSAGMLAARGQTLGKMAMGIRVVGPDGQNPSYWRAALRETIGKWVSQLIVYLGYFWMLWDADQQCWHDKIAGTTVERD